MTVRPLDHDRDLPAVTRMWREVGWIDGSDKQASALAGFVGSGHGLVAEVGGDAECLVHRAPGLLRHGAVDLPLCAITAVTTSHVGRRQGLASALMERALAEGVADGAAVAGLGMFEQGFYDRFGFGTGSYEHRSTFDPATLTVDLPSRPPVRLTIDDSDEMHSLLARRHRGHGAVVIDPPPIFRAEMAWTEQPLALGYRNGDGRLTHFVFGTAKDDHGPCDFSWIAYEEPRQLLELLGLLRSLGDQYSQVTLRHEPASIQLQDLIREPFRQRRVARFAGGHAQFQVAWAEVQFRILDLRACIAAVRRPVEPVRFSLRLRDPLSTRSSGWPGLAGDHTVRIGPSSTVEGGLEPGLPVLDASVNAFTRLWLGVRPASGLALTDDIAGPPALLDQLDDVLCLPTPQTGWSF